MSTLLEQYQEFREKVSILEETAHILSWDLRTTAPKGAAPRRMQVINHFQKQIFELYTSKEYGRLLHAMAEPEEFAKLDEPMQITVTRKLKEYEKQSKVPADFANEFSLMRMQCERTWEEAKRRNDYDLFAPWLKKNIEMTAQNTRYLEPDMDVLDALLDSHMEGVTCDMIDKLFTDVKNGLVPLLRKVQEHGRPDLSAMPKKVKVEHEAAVQKILLDYIGFDFNRGTTAQSMHGLTGMMAHDDTRMTNTFTEERGLESMFTAIHEGGHALYDQNVDPSLWGTSLHDLRSSDIHESQSRFMENILGRNKNFWIPIYDQVQEAMPELKDVDLDTFMRAANDIHASAVRTEADEMTYCLHIILRFELEKEFFREGLPVEKLRDRWNEKTYEMFGFYPEDDTHGILQDLHWSSVYFGYFPSYLLGSIYDGMLLEAVERDLGSVDTLLAEGRIKEIVKWLNENVHWIGSRYNAPELLKKICGKELTAEPLIEYFRKKVELYYE